MKKARFTEKQMVKILREADKAPVAEVTKKHGVSDQTIYGCRKRYGTSANSASPPAARGVTNEPLRGAGLPRGAPRRR